MKTLNLRSHRFGLSPSIVLLFLSLAGCGVETAEKSCDGLRSEQSQEDRAMDAKLYGQSFSLLELRDQAGTREPVSGGLADSKPSLTLLSTGEIKGYTGMNDVFEQITDDNPNAARALVVSGRLRLCGAVAVGELPSKDPKATTQEKTYKAVVLDSPAVELNGTTLTLRKDGAVLTFVGKPVSSNATRARALIPSR